ncbi:MAG: arylamine N-acetyltransferase [Ilumatobacter sp.]|nr:arylamine N-acetyltransferase [Ilumatobacter sp.]
MEDAHVDVEQYLEWIGFAGTPAVDLATLEELQRRHMTAVPFENLSITQGIHLTTDVQSSLDKIVGAGRGGWCFELNGAFAALLDAIGFRVTMLGAAVLLDGPSTVLEHLTLEVMVDEPHLVDVGFGDGFIRPIALNRTGPQDGGNGTYELFASPQGTTLTKHVDDAPAPQYRFKRVAHTLDEFTAVSDSMQVDPERHWHRKPFATRLLDGGPDRVTLTHDTLKVTRNDLTEELPVAAEEWDAQLHRWFGYHYQVR